jgi:hypothetical protein
MFEIFLTHRAEKALKSLDVKVKTLCMLFNVLIFQFSKSAY